MTIFRRLLLPLLALVSGVSAFADSSHLDRLRLLPPVLIKGEQGYSIDERMRRFKVEGVSVAVVKDFKILWTEARGLADREELRPATTSTLFQAGSISKPVAAAGVLRRVQTGQLQLDRDVNDYLKSWKVPENQFTAKQKVTLERLLSHSAGLNVHGFPGYAVGERVPTVPQILDGTPPANNPPVRVDFEPGTKVRYSGGGTTIAQLVQTDTTGKPFPELLQELVLRPAGMTHSTYEQPLPAEKLRVAAAGYRSDGSPVPGKRHTYPEMAAAGLWTTPEDLAHFAIAVARSVRGGDGNLLSKEMAARMTRPFLEQAALGFFLDTRGGETFFQHDGADEGFQALLIMHRDDGYGAVVMANSDNGINLASEILRGIAREQGWNGFLPEPIEPVKLEPADLASLSGRYQTNGDEAFTISAEGARLVGRPPFGDAYELFPLSRDLFVRKDRPTRYQVERSEKGVNGILLIAGNERVMARRMPPGEQLPSDFLAAGKIEAALVAYRKLYLESPDDRGIAEPRLNQLGYDLAGRNEFDKAIAVLKLNTELRPDSVNTYDSLAEIYLKSGDRVRAAETYRKLIEAVPRDSTTDPTVKGHLQVNAEAKLKELER